MTSGRKAEPGGSSKKRPRGRPRGTRNSVQPSNVISGLIDRLSLTGPILTFQDVADALTARTGVTVTRAGVWRFANGYEPRASRLRRVFGLPLTAPAPVCPKHGKVHVGRCPRRTFEENAARYDDWRRENAIKLAAIVGCGGKPL